jgi:hypothetical protein
MDAITSRLRDELEGKELRKKDILKKIEWQFSKPISCTMNQEESTRELS